jgi:hypothetical protein
MKKIIVTLLSLILLAFFVSCGGGKTVKEDSEKSSQKQTVQNRGQETGYALFLIMTQLCKRQSS